MRAWFETVADLEAGAKVLRDRRYGVIHAENRHFQRVCLRPFPKLVLLPAILLGMWRHRFHWADRCLLFYNQPRRHPGYLAVVYLVSGKGASLGTVRCALDVMDEIARLKRTDALVCDAMNWRISPRVLGRFGWEPHCPSRWHRHYIKRFYGSYPSPNRASRRSDSGPPARRRKTGQV